MPCPYKTSEPAAPHEIKKHRCERHPCHSYLSTRLFDFAAIERGCRMLLAKLHDAGFCPEAIVAAGARDKRTVPAVLGSNQTDIRVFRKGRIREAGERDEWVVLRGDHESGHANFPHHSPRAPPRIEVGG